MLRRPQPTCDAGSLDTFAGYLHACRDLGQLIAAVVVGMGSMALGPLPFDFVPRHLLVQLMPEVLIRDRLFAAGAPAVGLPLMDPLGDSILDVVGIGHDLDF